MDKNSAIEGKCQPTTPPTIIPGSARAKSSDGARLTEHPINTVTSTQMIPNWIAPRNEASARFAFECFPFTPNVEVVAPATGSASPI